MRFWVAGVVAALLLLVLLPGTAHAWTPGTHIYLGESVLANLDQLPAAVADLLRSYPFDFLYGNIAADTSMAKKYAPVGRHCHAWHVGQEIFDLAHTEALRSFGLGYLSHLAADTVAHNYFVPRQLVLTSSTAALGHSYWESRFETHLGDAYAKTAKEVILKDHAPSDAHLDQILSPTLFSHGINRRLFRGMVHLTESQSWQFAFQLILESTRWDLPNEDVESHMAVAFEYVMELLGEKDAAAGAARGRPRGTRTGGGGGGATLRAADALARVLARIESAAAVAAERVLTRQFFLQQFLRHFRIGLPLRRLHYLADEERHQLRLTALVAGDLAGARATPPARAGRRRRGWRAPRRHASPPDPKRCRPSPGR